MGGLIGAIVGLVCATAAVAWTARRNRRAGAARPVVEALGLGDGRSALGVERAASRDAARLAFPVFALFAVVFALAFLGSRQAGVLAAAAGVIYGSCAALAGRRLGR
jgi:hypothetical protein